MDLVSGAVLIVGGLWLDGRISRGFSSHPSNLARRVSSALAPAVQSDLLDASSVSDDTAQESGAFVLGEPDDYAPPQITAIEQAPAGINESLTPQGAKCCGGASARPIAKRPIAKLPVPGRAPATKPVTPTKPIVRRPVTGSRFFKFPRISPGRSTE